MRWSFMAAAPAAMCLAIALPARAQQLDTAYARQIREYTTDPRFLPRSVATLPASATIPSPLAYFHTIAGAPGVMHHAAEVYAYLRALAQATPRVRVEPVGTTEEGREIVLAIIADERTMGSLDRYKGLMRRLADPRTLSTAAADSAIAHAKPIYYLQGGLHSPEMGSPEMLMELAYRLAAGEDSATRQIREHVITIINPVSEPDGRDKQADWYYRFTKGRPEWDDSSTCPPGRGRTTRTPIRSS